MNCRRLPFFVIVFLVALSQFAFAAEPNGLPYYIDWYPVDGAGGFLVEAKNSSGEIVFTEQLEASSHDISLSLPSGDYSVRITTLDRLMHADSATDWFSVSILANAPPDFRSAKPKSFTTNSDIRMTVVAENMTESSSAYLVAPGKKRIDLVIKSNARNSFSLFGKALGEAGIYTLVLGNSPTLENRIRDAVTIRHPDAIVETVSPEKIPALMSGAELTITGKRFSSDISFTYQNTNATNGSASFPLVIVNRSSESVTCRIADAIDPGTYRIFVASNSWEKSVACSSFVVEEPPPPEPVIETAVVEETSPESIQDAAPENGAAEEKPADSPVQSSPPFSGRFSLALGGACDLRNDAWASIYPGPGASAFLSSGLYLLGNPFPEDGVSVCLSIDLRTDVQYLRQSQIKYVGSSIINAAFNLGPALTVAFPFMNVRCYAGGGLCSTWLTFTQLNGISSSKNSLDPTAIGGLSVSWPFFESLSLGAGGQIMHLFMKTPATVYSASLFVSATIPFSRR
jgi:hypothetical protein